MHIWVGFEKITHNQLGFHEAFSYEIQPMWLHVFRRHGETLAFISMHKDVRVSDFMNAVTRYLDYPTLPFIRMLEILENQQEIFMEKIVEAMREKRLCCSTINYIADIAGLLRFALMRRGVDVDIKYCWTNISARKLGEIRRAIERADEPAPFLGNTVYVEIAERAYHLLVAAIGLIMLLPHGGCSCTC